MKKKMTECICLGDGFSTCGFPCPVHSKKTKPKDAIPSKEEIKTPETKISEVKEESKPKTQEKEITPEKNMYSIATGNNIKKDNINEIILKFDKTAIVNGINVKLYSLGIK